MSIPPNLPTYHYLEKLFEESDNLEEMQSKYNEVVRLLECQAQEENRGSYRFTYTDNLYKLNLTKAMKKISKKIEAITPKPIPRPSSIIDYSLVEGLMRNQPVNGSPARRPEYDAYSTDPVSSLPMYGRRAGPMYGSRARRPWTHAYSTDPTNPHAPRPDPIMSLFSGCSIL